MVPFENNSKQRSLDLVCLRQNTRRQNSVDQFVLCQAFGLRRCLQVLVRDVKVRVACSTVFGQRFDLVSMVSINLGIRFYGVETGDAGESIEPEPHSPSTA